MEQKKHGAYDPKRKRKFDVAIASNSSRSSADSNVGTLIKVIAGKNAEIVSYKAIVNKLFDEKGVEIANLEGQIIQQKDDIFRVCEEISYLRQ